LIARSYHLKRGDRAGSGRRKVIIPDTAHGTNPASSALAGFQVVVARSNKRGFLEAAEIRRILDDQVAALMGVAKPGDMGADIVQLNLHKTFSTPHGGGGPGAGPIAVRKHLEPFLPYPRLVREGNGLILDGERPDSIGRLRSFHGNFGMLVRAYSYILALGGDGL